MGPASERHQLVARSASPCDSWREDQGLSPGDTRMRQLSFVEPGTVRWEEAPDARLETPDDALVRPLVVTTCDIDHAIVHGLVPFPGPFPLGHEFVAEVVETGGAVRRFRWSNLPGGVPPTAVASASDNLPDAWRAVAPFLAESPGADVLVVGGWGRSIALYAVAIARALGAGRIDYIDTIASGWRSRSGSAPAASRARRRAAQARSPSR